MRRGRTASGGIRSRLVVPATVSAVTGLTLLCGCSSPSASGTHGPKGHRAPASSPATTATTSASSSTSSTVTHPVADPGTALAPAVTVPGAADRAGAQATVTRIIADFVANDWGGLYDLSASPIQAGQTRQAFITSMTSQSLPKIVSGSLRGAGSESTQNGLDYWTQDVVLQVERSAGTSSPYTADIELAKQGGAWKFWTTSTPTPAS